MIKKFINLITSIFHNHTDDTNVDCESCNIVKTKAFNSTFVLPYIVTRYQELGFSDATPLRMQLVLWFCYGIILQKYNTRLCSELPVACKVGPVFMDSYNTHNSGNLDFLDSEFEDQCSTKILGVIDDVILSLGALFTENLKELCTELGTPWYSVTEAGERFKSEDKSTFEISDDLTKEFFKKLNETKKMVDTLEKQGII